MVNSHAPGNCKAARAGPPPGAIGRLARLHCMLTAGTGELCPNQKRGTQWFQKISVTRSVAYGLTTAHILYRRISWAIMSLSRLLITAMAGDMRLSITVISASSSTARQRLAGRRLPPRRIHPNRKATKRPICEAGPWIGARLAFGRSSPGAPTSQASFGVERFRAVFSAQAITDRAGR